MERQENYNNIKALILNGETHKAISLLNQLIESSVPSDVLYYLRGNAYRKQGDWPTAINDYLKAIEINPESPASEAYKIAIDIQDFYNKDMYNQ